jgi:hypothetical protein
MNSIVTGTGMEDTKSDCEQLLTTAVEVGMLALPRTHGVAAAFFSHLFPLALTLGADGTVAMAEGYDPHKRPHGAARTQRLKDGLRAAAAAHKIRASALVDKTRGIDPSSGESVEGILVCMDHRNGVSVERWFVPRKQAAAESPFMDWVNENADLLAGVSIQPLAKFAVAGPAVERPGAADIFPGVH